MTQATLARAAGVSQSAIASYETHQRLFSRATFRLAAALRVDPIWLQTGKGDMIPPADTRPAELDEPAHTVRESVPEYWPFPAIPPRQLNALSPAHRRLLERTAVGFVATCLEEYAAEQMKTRRER